MAMATSSPRLLSPPPPAEIQIDAHPTPATTGSSSDAQAQTSEQATYAAGSKRRIHPGTKAADMATGPPLVPLNELDSAFQLQEHLAAMHYHYTARNTQPMTRAHSLLLARSPPGTDDTLWLYELCRFLIAKCNTLIVGFLFDSPPCSAATCPEMQADTWQFLCAIHEQPKPCCAIDYCCHTLDWAANIVTNPKIFPSRFALHVDPQRESMAFKALVNVFRRIHRIFGHAWFQHRGVFWSVESESGLYVLFKTVCDMYGLLPPDNFKLPPEAEGLEQQSESALGNSHQQETNKQPKVTILSRPAVSRGDTIQPQDDKSSGVGRSSTRRHVRSTPSTGSVVPTVVEADEEDGSENSQKVHSDIQIPAPQTVEDDENDDDIESADISVYVQAGVMQDDGKEKELKGDFAVDGEISEDDTDDDAASEVTIMEASLRDDEHEQQDKDSKSPTPQQLATTKVKSEPKKSSAVQPSTDSRDSRQIGAMPEPSTIELSLRPKSAHKSEAPVPAKSPSKPETAPSKKAETSPSKLPILSPSAKPSSQALPSDAKAIHEDDDIDEEHEDGEEAGGDDEDADDNNEDDEVKQQEESPKASSNETGHSKTKKKKKKVTKHR